MKRDALQFLGKWKDSPIRVPLVVRGARQVGKSWLIRSFGQSFEHFVEINFDRDKNASVIFEGAIDTAALIQKIQMYVGLPVEAGKTLIFLDEIQECEPALRALRYFKEELPDLHIIAAGSLLDFALESMGMPVGRVEFLYLHPLSFGEFLEAVNKAHLRQGILQKENLPVIHEQLLEQFKYYSAIGGMPAVVQAWLDHQDLALCQSVQERVILAYRQDFAKYAKSAQIPHVDKIFNSIPYQLGNKFKFTHVDDSSSSYYLKLALELLIKAGVALPCYHTSAQGFPLGAGIDLKRFKIFFFDVGLAQNLLKLNLKEWLLQPIDAQHKGAIAEQLVGQEYVAYSSVESEPSLFYWQREARNANAELDFIFEKQDQMVPVEVKSGKGGRLFGLNAFCDSHPKAATGVKISVNPYVEQVNRIDIPLYAVEGFLKWSESN